MVALLALSIESFTYVPFNLYMYLSSLTLLSDVDERSICTAHTYFTLFCVCVCVFGVWIVLIITRLVLALQHNDTISWSRLQLSDRKASLFSSSRRRVVIVSFSTRINNGRTHPFPVSVSGGCSCSLTSLWPSLNKTPLAMRHCLPGESVDVRVWVEANEAGKIHMLWIFFFLFQLKISIFTLAAQNWKSSQSTW